MGKSRSKKQKSETKAKKNASNYSRILMFSLLIILSGFVIYNQTTSFSLVYNDDNIFVEKINKNLDIWESFDRTIGTSFYRPILFATFIIDARNAEIEGTQIPKNDPGHLEKYIDESVYHRSNLFFHVLASLMVFLLFIKLKFNSLTALIMGMIYNVHPVLTPAVAWISGRNDSLITLFVTASFFFLISFLDSKSNIKKSAYLILHLLFFMISLYTKEIAALFPAAGFLYIRLYRNEKLISKDNIILAASWLIIGLIWFSMRNHALSAVQNPDEIGLTAFIENLPTIPALLGKIFLPAKMIVLSNFEAFSIISGFVFAALLTVLILRMHSDTKKQALFAVSWFFIFLLPTLTIRILNVDDFFDYAEHRAYLPMFGIILIIALFLRDRKIDFRKAIPAVSAVLILAALTVRTFDYQQHFENRKTYWAHFVNMYPEKSRGYYDLAMAYRMSEEYEKAEQLYLEAMKRNPGNENIYYELFVMYSDLKNYEKLRMYAGKMLSLDPNNQIASFYMGKAYFDENNYEKSLPYIEQAVTPLPKIPSWYLFLGHNYLKLKQPEKAIAAYQKAIEKLPQNVDAHFSKAYAHSLLGQNSEAADEWLITININPKKYTAYRNLIKYYFKEKDFSNVLKFIDMLKNNGGEIDENTANMVKFINSQKN